MRYQACARVADARCACIADTGHARALSQQVHHAVGRLRFVVLVQRQQLRAAFVDAVGAQEHARVPCVLAGYMVGQGQHMQSAQADVSQIADGCRHHIERAFRIILGTGGLVGSLQGGVK